METQSIPVLLIDDRLENRLLLEEILQPPDYRLINARSEKEAFASPAAEEIAVILLALRSSDPAGFETARRIKQNERFRRTPILFLSDFSLDPEQILKAYSVGAVDTLIAPFHPERVKAKVSAIVDLSVQGRERWREEKARADALEIDRTRLYQKAGEEIAKRKEIEKRWRAQQVITRALADAGDLNEVTPVILQTVCENFGWEMGVFWLTYREAPRLQCVATWHLPSVQMVEFKELCQKKTFSRNEGLPGRIWGGEKAAWIPDVIGDSNFPRKPVAAKEGLHAAFGFPIRGEEEVLGVLEFFSHEVREPDQALLEFIADIGSQIGRFIERSWATEALRDSGTQLRLAAEAARAKLWVWDIPEDHIYFMSPSPSGGSVSESLGSVITFLNRVHHEDYPAVRDALGAAMAGEKAFDLQFRLNAPDGSTPWYFGRAHVLRNAAGGPVRMIGVNMEITEQKRLEEKLKKKTAEAEESSRLQSQFIAKLSHKWRTPISGILGYGHLLLEGKGGEIDPKQKILIENVIRNANDLIDLIKDVLGLAKIEAGKGSVHRELIHLPSLLGEVVEEIKPLIDRKPVEIYWHTVPELALIESDADKIKRIFTHLLSNAVQYTPRGIIRIIEKNVPEKNGVEISVRDTGIGIRPDALPTLFDPFHPVDAGDAGNARPRLSAVKDLVDLLQGEIRVESKVGKGSTFRVFLPYTWSR
ncbi:MAG: response regulator [Candidatus Manganitrophaceae bacterium]|nr:MAG: response regulator [Candidatus Manganitrophaceae bacterium]